MSKGAQRRLAAIVAADVAGYSRLMGADEEGTLAVLKGHRREHIDPKIAEHNGRIVKTTGDGILLEFASVLDAARCCLDVQRGMAERNADIPAERRMLFRVGINLGDIIIDGEDIHGDGVNVAARLEALCEPGGIAVSGNVHEQVQDRLDGQFVECGSHEVKNIVRPVKVWRWSPENSGMEGQPKVTAPASTLHDGPSIAVLPFDNMSGDAEQEYFADGISEDIITDLSKVSGLLVIARNSSFAYKGQNPDIRKVCRELSVRHVLEGSVRKSGRRVRITAQLIDGSNGGHLWAERYDRDLEDIFTVQDEVTREIVQALKLALTDRERRRRDARGRVDPVAYDHFLRARNCVYRFTAEAMRQARDELDQAIARDAALATAYAMLAIVHCVEHANAWNGAGADHLDRALDLVNKALATDPDEPQAYYALALTKMWQRELDEAAKAAERAIELDPSFAGVYTALGTILDFAGQHEAAVEKLRRALLLDPRYDTALQFIGRAQFSLRQYDEAEASLKRRLALSPKSDMSRVFLAAIYGHTGRHEEARRLWKEIMQINPDFSIDRVRRVLPYRDAACFDHFEAGLTAAGLPI
ncbi:MAG: tetratricopeptide repeat protein [Alphaproteobacteria bacterium]|nr:tetratricopeptide repeat protein [Alphaproteobacteria bacterium]